MSKIMEKNTLCAIDIGTSKIAVLVAQLTEANHVNLIAAATQTSKGLKRGLIVNIDATIKSIQIAIQEVENICGFSIKEAYVSMSDDRVHSFNSHGVVAIEKTEVSQSDIDRVIEAAKAVPIPTDQEILHILCQEFLVDKHNSIQEPKGMSGVRLETMVHMVSASSNSIQNIKKCVNHCDIKVKNIILEQLAASYGVMNTNEKELGTCLIDIGAGTTDIAVFFQGMVKYTKVIPIAGNHITNDISQALNLAIDTAEHIKIQHGCCAMTNLVNFNDSIELSGPTTQLSQSISLQMLTDIIEARIGELFSIIYQMLNENNLLKIMPAGIILTGGSANMHGIDQLATDIFKRPVRVSGPIINVSEKFQNILNNPAYSTGVGLVKYSHMQLEDSNTSYADVNEIYSPWSKLKNWFNKYFRLK